jgi:predicted RNA-binding Zn-ribbon protein involved in translation (DUF1610 family)
VPEENVNPLCEARSMKQTSVQVDLTMIDGNGDFSCPKCGITISPDDSSEEKYSVLETKVNRNGLEEVVILCNNCGSHIHLTGFSLLHDMA